MCFGFFLDVVFNIFRLIRNILIKIDLLEFLKWVIVVLYM
jgi:hypothetical protein